MLRLQNLRCVDCSSSPEYTRTRHCLSTIAAGCRSKTADEPPCGAAFGSLPLSVKGRQREVTSQGRSVRAILLDAWLCLAGSVFHSTNAHRGDHGR